MPCISGILYNFFKNPHMTVVAKEEGLIGVIERTIENNVNAYPSAIEQLIDVRNILLQNKHNNMTNLSDDDEEDSDEDGGEDDSDDEGERGNFDDSVIISINNIGNYNSNRLVVNISRPSIYFYRHVYSAQSNVVRLQIVRKITFLHSDGLYTFMR